VSEFKVSDEVLHNINGCFEGYPVMMEEEVRAIVAAVARAAQVQVLEWFEAYAERYCDDQVGRACNELRVELGQETQ
jgi:hypothetical protein